MPEPVTLAEVKDSLNLEGVDSDDALLTSLIAAARRVAETFIGRTIAGDDPELTGDDALMAKQAIILIVGNCYSDREGKGDFPVAAGWLLRPLRKWDDGGEPESEEA